MASPIVVAALYRFVRLPDYTELRDPLLRVMLDNGIRGTLLLASEGINGTVAGSAAAIDFLLDYLRADSRLQDFDCNLSHAIEMPFNRARVKLKKEIVSMGVNNIDPANTGTYVDPADWNALIEDPDVLLIDTRNEYETAIGSFANAIHPNTQSFREFPAYAERHLAPAKQRKLAMFCTGGIRCEKATAYLKQQGFDQVYHLKGGILKYFEAVAAKDSLWQGECFVFDNRVSVDQSLQKGSYAQCHACRRPITDADMRDPRYHPGVSCPACHDGKTDLQRYRYREREKQVKLATARGEQHIGADASLQARQRKTLKLESKRAQRARHRSAGGG